MTWSYRDFPATSSPQFVVLSRMDESRTDLTVARRIETSRIEIPQPAGRISVVLIEDNRLVREGIATLLNQASDFTVVAGTSDYDLAWLREAKPRVVLLYAGLRNVGNLKLVEKMKQHLSEFRVVVMDLIPVHEDLLDFIRAGVHGFILKDASVEDLAKGIRLVAS